MALCYLLAEDWHSALEEAASVEAADPGTPRVVRRVPPG
jgi:hypothetical protein